MPTYQAPNTWAVLQAMQYLIQTQVLVNSASPFSVWTPQDQQTYGTSNPNGSITNVIHIGDPKNWDSGNLYQMRCHIIPPMSEQVYRRALGGKIWDWGDIMVMFWSYRKDNWQQSLQNIIAARDAMYPILGEHGELPGAPTVIAGTIQVGNGPHNGYNIANVVGEDWDQWGFTWRIKQEYYIPGGVTN